MTTSLADSSLIILVANGFEETQITTVQRALTKHKVPYKIIAPEQGLVNGWQGGGWGHCFTVDQQINEALGSDFDSLVIIGGMRSAEKLRTNPHTRRIINHFLEAKKPLAAFGEAVGLLALSPKSAGLAVTCRSENLEEIKAAGMTVVEEPLAAQGPVVTSASGNVETWIEAFVAQFPTSEETGEREAA